MDRYVIDSSVLIKWFVSEVNTTEALQIRSKYEAQAISLLAPDLINAEIGNIIWKKQSKGTMPPVDARLVLDDFLTVELELIPTAQLLMEAFQLATLYRRSVYDSLYLALSQRERCPLVIADERLYNAVGGAMKDIVLLSNWK